MKRADVDLLAVEPWQVSTQITGRLAVGEEAV